MCTGIGAARLPSYGKKQARLSYRVGLVVWFVVETSSLDGLGDLDGDINHVRILALDLLEARTAANHAIELLDHFIDRLVEVVRFRVGIVIVAADLQRPLGDKFLLVRPLVTVVFQFHPHADDSVFVFEEFFNFGLNHISNRIGEIHVQTGDDDIMLLHIFLFLFCCGFSVNGDD